jgi:hypothetical protein
MQPVPERPDRAIKRLGVQQWYTEKKSTSVNAVPESTANGHNEQCLPIRSGSTGTRWTGRCDAVTLWKGYVR